MHMGGKTGQPHVEKGNNNQIIYENSLKMD